MQDSSKENTWFPVVLNLRFGHALILGGGEMARSKATLLLGAGAQIYVIAHSFDKDFYVLARASNLHLVTVSSMDEKTIQPYCVGCRLVYMAIEDQEVQNEVGQFLASYSMPVCRVDNPRQSNFITPAIVRRGEVQVAISTGGAAPVLSRCLRHLIETVLPHGLSKLVHFMGVFRTSMARLLPDIGLRRRVWENFLSSEGAVNARQGRYGEAEKSLKKLVEDKTVPTKKGEVWLVGAGPGNPDLLTLAALRLLQQADSILYDNLVSPAILDYSRRDAQRIYVGKQKGHYVLSQEAIQEELVRRALRGERVLRLKGGDPFVFGRGGEEMAAVIKAGIHLRVVPAITAANGCASYAGIPLTHRECAQQCLFLTGHSRPGQPLNIAWEAVALKNQTIVVYMGLSRVGQLCEAFMSHGLPGDWPAAVVAQGTLPAQRVVIGTLSDLTQQVYKEGVKSPALLIVGQVINHRLR